MLTVSIVPVFIITAAMMASWCSMPLLRRSRRTGRNIRLGTPLAVRSRSRGDRRSLPDTNVPAQPQRSHLPSLRTMRTAWRPRRR